MQFTDNLRETLAQMFAVDLNHVANINYGHIALQCDISEKQLTSILKAIQQSVQMYGEDKYKISYCLRMNFRIGFLRIQNQ